jgi:hypothetical protein
VQAIHYLSMGMRCYENGPWDEDLLWMFGPDALTAPIITPERKNLHADVGGYYTLRAPASFVFARCATFRNRPGQADMLHVDLWWKGQNVALDAGTYSYNAPEPWDNPLAHTAYHNTAAVDDADQMDRAGRFLWLPWLRGQVRWSQTSPGGYLSYWEGGHDGYQRLRPPVSHRRAVLRLGEAWWLIVDALTSPGEHRYRLHWLLPAVPYEWAEGTGQLVLKTPAGDYHLQTASSAGNATHSLMRADAGGPRGWRAPYYYHREPALSVDLTVKTSAALFWTLFGPGPSNATRNGDTLQVVTRQWQALLHWQMEAASPLIHAITVSGVYQDRLVIV